MVGPLELAGTGYIQHGAAPGLFSEEPPLAGPIPSTLPIGCIYCLGMLFQRHPYWTTAKGFIVSYHHKCVLYKHINIKLLYLFSSTMQDGINNDCFCNYSFEHYYKHTFLERNGKTRRKTEAEKREEPLCLHHLLHLTHMTLETEKQWINHSHLIHTNVYKNVYMSLLLGSV